jgi:predicted dehydrogenase
VLLAGSRSSMFAADASRPNLRSPSGELRVAVVGLRIKGNQHVDQLRETKNVRLVAICDADTAIMGATAQRLDREGVKVDQVQDYRRILDRADIDAVIIATPNHLHTLQAMMALQAGKDVYLEKPVSHTIEEGRQLTAAARHHQRVIAAGTQKRSDPGLLEAFAALHAGELGAIKVVRGFCYKLRKPIGLVSAPVEVPPTVDLDLFCGPAPLERPVRERFHYDWHWQWVTGNGDIGNQGIHELDLCRMAVGEAGRPRRVMCFGGRFGPADNGETPNTQLAWFDYATAPVLFEVRGLPRATGSEAEDAYRGVRVGIVVDCEGGSMIGGTGASFLDHAGNRIRRFAGDGGRGHLQNFVDAALARKPEQLAAPVAESAISTDLVHFANLAYRSGQPLPPEEISDRLQGSPAAAEAFTALRTHLAANQADTGTPPWRLGGWLDWNESAGRFSGGAGHEQANRLITRHYRAPWTLPKLT